LAVSANHSRHPIPPPTAGLARKQLTATVIGQKSWNVSRPERFVLAETKQFQKRLETVFISVLFQLCGQF